MAESPEVVEVALHPRKQFILSRQPCKIGEELPNAPGWQSPIYLHPVGNPIKTRRPSQQSFIGNSSALVHHDLQHRVLARVKLGTSYCRSRRASLLPVSCPKDLLLSCSPSPSCLISVSDSCEDCAGDDQTSEQSNASTCEESCLKRGQTMNHHVPKITIKHRTSAPRPLMRIHYATDKTVSEVSGNARQLLVLQPTAHQHDRPIECTDDYATHDQEHETFRHLPFERDC